MDEKKELLEIKDLYEHLLTVANAKEKILLSYLKEEKELYEELRKKILEIRQKDRAIEETRTIMSQNERLFTLGIMAASLAHEIKNPLIVIFGMMERMEPLITDSKAQGYFQIIKTELNRIQGIMERLREYYKPKETEKQLNDLNLLIKETVNLTEHYLSRFKNVSISYELSDGIRPFYFNRGQIQQVLVNLIINSAQAMPERGGKIYVRTFLMDEEAIIEIEDTGKGIKEENLDKIFSPFFTTKPPGEGTGIGLSISKEIVERHSGKITVESKEGVGTKFTIHLPYIHHN
ncbi:MAG: ATP-binding protein [Proteobacteria bacterium]|nr:ATP-binding protein [Pseudomonadota bacterium]